MAKKIKPVYEGDRLRQTLVEQGRELGEFCRRTISRHGEPVGPEPERGSLMSVSRLLELINKQDPRDAAAVSRAAIRRASERLGDGPDRSRPFTSGQIAYRHHLRTAKRNTKEAVDKFAKALRRAARS